jgi:heme oxygenase (mycobilin-producing)
VLALNRFVVVPERTVEFTRQAHAALAALAARPGFRDGELARNLDQPDHWCLVTRWQSVGAYRRALGDYAVRVDAVPLLAQAVNEPSAYESLVAASAGAELVTVEGDRVVDAATDRRD